MGKMKNLSTLPKVYDGRSFSWLHRVGVAEASTLGIPPAAVLPGVIAIRSHKTGAVKAFTYVGLEEGTAVYTELNPTGSKRIQVRIIND